jgi:hypothetical protein
MEPDDTPKEPQMAEPEQQHEREWHLDKRVNISIIAAVLMQTALAIWWSSSINTRVDQLERGASLAANQDSRIVRLETKMDLIFQNLTEIKSLLRGQRAAEQ